MTVDSLVYTGKSPFSMVHSLIHTACFVKYLTYCSIACFLHLTMYLADLPIVAHTISPYPFELLHSTPDTSIITYSLTTTNSTPSTKDKIQISTTYWALARLTLLIPEYVKLVPTLGLYACFSLFL